MRKKNHYISVLYSEFGGSKEWLCAEKSVLTLYDDHFTITDKLPNPIPSLTLSFVQVSGFPSTLSRAALTQWLEQWFEVREPSEGEDCGEGFELDLPSLEEVRDFAAEMGFANEAEINAAYQGAKDL